MEDGFAPGLCRSIITDLALLRNKSSKRIVTISSTCYVDLGGKTKHACCVDLGGKTKHACCVDLGVKTKHPYPFADLGGKTKHPYSLRISAVSLAWVMLTMLVLWAFSGTVS
jgi:hypothetical protein